MLEGRCCVWMSARGCIVLYSREVSKAMNNQSGHIQRQGQIYRFSIDGSDYAAFVWREGKQFRGRIEGQPQVPQYTGRTALMVRDALKLWLVRHRGAE